MLPPYLCVGLGESCKLAREEKEVDLRHIDELFKYMVQRLTGELDYTKINGDLEWRYKGNLNISFGFVNGDELIEELKNEVAISAGAACISEPSYIL